MYVYLSHHTALTTEPFRALSSDTLGFEADASGPPPEKRTRLEGSHVTISKPCSHLFLLFLFCFFFLNELEILKIFMSSGDDGLEAFRVLVTNNSTFYIYSFIHFSLYILQYLRISKVRYIYTFEAFRVLVRVAMCPFLGRTVLF